MAKSILSSPKIAKVAGAPYSSGTKVGNLLFTAGMVSLNEKGEIVGRGDIRAQTRQVLDNVKAIVEAGGGKMTDIAKTTVYITDLANFAAMNEVYKTYFPTDPPARATVKADLVNKDFLVEIDAFAVLG
ncbi:MAG TPA: RidA family protein [Stellaceae bacterium]|nr:RidA family protein [Stellaceae bacterium]